MVEINECVGAPEKLPYLFARNDLTWTIRKHNQDLPRLLGEPDANAVLPQFPVVVVELKRSERSSRVPSGLSSHRALCVQCIALFGS
jgi:hypothetical protein